MSEKRIDFVGKLDGRVDLGDGSVRFNARLTRTGVFDYGDHKELRTADEVFKKEALDSFRGLTVTVGHRAWLDAGNWREFAVGHVGDDVRADEDGIHVDASVVLKDKSAIAKADAGELIEISMGYSVDLQATPGQTADGQKYDSVQTNIQGNHAALGPRAWGRAGGSVRLLDGAAYADDMTIPEKRIDAPAANDQLQKDLDAARADNEAVRKERDAARKDATDATARADKAEAERDAAKKDATEAKADAAKARTDASATTDAAVEARVHLIDAARGVLGSDFKATKKDGEKTVSMSDKEIRIAVIAKVDPALKLDGKTDAYIEARFDLATESVKTDRSELGKVNETTMTPAGSTPTKSVLDAAHEKAEADRKIAAQAGPPVGALVRK